MSWLVLAPEYDEAGRWVAEGLADTGPETVLFVTDADLAEATWAHHVADDATSTRVELADGRTIDSADVEGTVNRLTHVPPRLVDALVDDDRQYGLQELSALVMSWLASFPVPTLNPPDPRGLSGAWRSPAEWALLAGATGLDAAPVLFDSATPQPFGQQPFERSGWNGGRTPAPLVEDVIVVGGSVFSGPGLTAADADACRRLAELADTPILGIAFAEGPMSPVVGVTPLPDVRAGGDAMIEALAEALRAEPVVR